MTGSQTSCTGQLFTTRNPRVTADRSVWCGLGEAMRLDGWRVADPTALKGPSWSPTSGGSEVPGCGRSLICAAVSLAFPAFVSFSLFLLLEGDLLDGGPTLTQGTSRPALHLD